MGGAATDKRYGTRKWKRVRLGVLVRDLYRCWVPGCPVSANVADHVMPASPDMPEWLFFDPSNLRASCKRHNLARGVAARLEQETRGVPDAPRNPLVSRSSFMRPRVL